MRNNILAYGFFIFMLGGIVNECFSQRCGTVVTREQVAFERSQWLNANRRSTIDSSIDKTLSIHAYIILDSLGNPSFSEQDIIDAISDASGPFEPIGLSFQVCEFTYIENWQYAEWTDMEDEPEATTLYWQDNVINMYFPHEILSPADAGGYAHFPGGADVVVISNLGSITHELGHFFGLYHTFEMQFGAELIPRVDCDILGDLLCDTEADPGGNQDDNLNGLCEYVFPSPPGVPGNWYLPPTDNIMSYYGSCRCKFTPDQYNRMVQQYFTLRSYLW